MSRMNVNLAGVELKNPVMTASGTFGSGTEYSEFVDLNRLGAVVTKGVANVKEIFRSLKNMIQRSSSMSVANLQRIIVRL